MVLLNYGMLRLQNTGFILRIDYGEGIQSRNSQVREKWINGFKFV